MTLSYLLYKEETPPRVEHFKFPKEKIQHFFPAGTPVQVIEDSVIKALELWHKNQ